MTRRLCGIAAVLFAAVGIGAGAGSASATAPPGATTFDSTGAVQQYTVPAGITRIHVHLVGGRGGLDTQGNPRPPGRGGIVDPDLPVAPGDQFDVYVGGNGGSGASAPGGYN